MRLLSIAVVMLASTFVLCGNGLADDTDAADIAMIKSLRDQSNKALTAHDLEKFVSFFDDDYIINYGSSKKTLSREAEIESLKKSFAESPDMDYLRTPVSVYISASHPLAMEHGVWRGGYDNKTFYSGRYTAGWRKTKGVWKIHNELFVTLKCEGKGC